MSDEESVFSRWSRRKRSVVREDQSRPGLDPGPLAAPGEVPGEVPGQARDALPIAEPETEEEEAALLEQLGLPLPESLGEGDDFAPFMKSGVPEFLRKRALRVLWRSNPILANLDGLNDYDEDFNSPELTKKVLATGYQVGRGFIKSVTEALEEGEAIADLDADQPADNTLPEAAQTPAEEQEIKAHVTEAAASEPDPDVPPRPRRMRFET